MTMLIGQSQVIIQLLEQIRRIAASDHTVLIYGETGSGKELVAKTVHQLSLRGRASFAAINCAAISPQLFESELFGHEKGAFTGAAGQHKGIFEQARGGTLLLDEIGELPLEVQAKLLRVLENRSIRRVGGKEEIPIDVRVVAATHRDLHELVKNKKFREDLYYRLHVVPLYVPPLRDRIEDIPLLVKHFMGRLMPEKSVELTPQAFQKLLSYTWPGNVRELKNVISRSLIYCNDNCIQEEDIQFSHAYEKTFRPLQKSQENLIEETYRTIKSVRKVGEILGIGKSTVQRKIKKKIDITMPD